MSSAAAWNETTNLYPPVGAVHLGAKSVPQSDYEGGNQPRLGLKLRQYL